MNKIKAAALAALALVLTACAGANESGEKAAGCEGKQSVVREKSGVNDQGHLMMLVWCREGDVTSTWYVTWPKSQADEYNSYKVGDVYPH